MSSEIRVDANAEDLEPEKIVEYLDTGKVPGTSGNSMIGRFRDWWRERNKRKSVDSGKSP